MVTKMNNCNLRILILAIRKHNVRSICLTRRLAQPDNFRIRDPLTILTRFYRAVRFLAIRANLQRGCAATYFINLPIYLPRVSSLIPREDDATFRFTRSSREYRALHRVDETTEATLAHCRNLFTVTRIAAESALKLWGV